MSLMSLREIMEAEEAKPSRRYVILSESGIRELAENLYCSEEECWTSIEAIEGVIRRNLELDGQKPSEFKEFQRIRLKHIKEMLDQCDKRPDEVVAPAVAVLMAEKKAIEEFLGEPA